MRSFTLALALAWLWPAAAAAQQLTQPLDGHSAEAFEVREVAELYYGRPKLGEVEYRGSVLTLRPNNIRRADETVGTINRRASNLQFTVQAAPGHVVTHLRVEADASHGMWNDPNAPDAAAARSESRIRLALGGRSAEPRRILSGPNGQELSTTYALRVPVDANRFSGRLNVRVSANHLAGSEAGISVSVNEVRITVNVVRVAPDVPVNWFAFHALGRTSHGLTPAQFRAIEGLTTETAAINYADRQLKRQLELDPNRPWPTNLNDDTPLPAAIPLVDSTNLTNALANRVSSWQVVSNTPRPSANQLADYTLQRMTQSQAQLREVMTYFWDNHFHTSFRANMRGHYEWVENQAFRSLAFGTFRELLGASAKSAAMLLYLNQEQSRRGAPNENYARELMELHTLGVDAGYTAADISNAARVLTGWRKNSGTQPGFRFVANNHERGDKSFSALFPNRTITYRPAANGVLEGEELLSMLADMDSTARFISRKLIRLFVTETPSEAYVQSIATVFVNSGGDIKKVLIAIFTSEPFRDPANYLTKVKTPLELVTSAYRNVAAQRRFGRMRAALGLMGMPLFQAGPPTGYSELGVDWLGTNLALNYSKLAFELVDPNLGLAHTLGGRTTTWQWLSARNRVTEDQVLDELGGLVLQGAFSASERARFRTLLRSGGENPLQVSNRADERPLDRTLGAMLVSPGFYYQ